MRVRAFAVTTILCSFIAIQNAQSKDYFDGVVCKDLKVATKKATEKNMPIFMAIYDDKNPTKSKLDYSLAYFLEYEKTKTFVRKNFIQVLTKSSSRGVSQYVPKDEPLENCLLVILCPDGKALVTESAYANPDVGLKRVGEYLEKWEAYKKEHINQKDPTTKPKTLVPKPAS